jgi:hypothetical protein
MSISPGALEIWAIGNVICDGGSHFRGSDFQIVSIRQKSEACLGIEATSDRGISADNR